MTLKESFAGSNSNSDAFGIFDAFDYSVISILL